MTLSLFLKIILPILFSILCKAQRQGRPEHIAVSSMYRHVYDQFIFRKALRFRCQKYVRVSRGLEAATTLDL